MNPIIVEGFISDDGRIIVNLPDDIHVGRVRLTIEPLDTPTESEGDLTFEEARAILQKAGALSDLGIPGNFEPLSDDELDKELEELNRNLPPSRPSEELINEDRGEY